MDEHFDSEVQWAVAKMTKFYKEFSIAEGRYIAARTKFRHYETRLRKLLNEKRSVKNIQPFGRDEQELMWEWLSKEGYFAKHNQLADPPRRWEEEEPLGYGENLVCSKAPFRDRCSGGSDE